MTCCPAGEVTGDDSPMVGRGGLMVPPIAMVVGVVALTVRSGNTESAWTLLSSTAAIAVVGAVLAGLRPRYVGGWLLLTTGVAFLLGQLAGQLAFADLDLGRRRLVAWVGRCG